MSFEEQSLRKELKKNAPAIDTQQKSEMIKENKYVHKIEEPDPMMLMAQMQQKSQKAKTKRPEDDDDETNLVKRNVESIIHGTKATQKFRIKHTPAKYALLNMYKGKYQACVENGNDKSRLKYQKKGDLLRKHRNANTITKTEKQLADENFKNFNYYYSTIGNDYNQRVYKDLSQFMVSSDKSENMTMLGLYLGESIQDQPGKKGAIKSKNKERALDNMTNVLMKLDISDISLRTDRDIIRHARKLEKITSMACAYDRLLQDNPEYMDKMVTNELNREDNNNQEQERYLRKSLEEVRKRLEVLRAIAAYYQSYKNITTDKFFKNHSDKDLSPDYNGDNMMEQQALAEKIDNTYTLKQTAENLLTEYNNGSSDNNDNSGDNSSEE